MTTHGIGRVIAVTALALTACSAGPGSAPVATSRSALIAIPPDTSFHAFLCSGTVKGDPAGDQVTGGAWRDIVGDADHPAFYRAADAENVYFRMRVSGDPRKPGSLTELLPSSWDVLVDTDGDLRTYEYMFTADGNLPGGNAVQLVRNSVKEPNNPSDPAMDDATNDLIADLTPATDYWSVKVATDGLTPSSFGGDPDYFITLRLPKYWLTRIGVNLDQDFVVWAGTNARTYSLNSDFGCFVGIPSNLGDAGNDPGDLDPPDAINDSVTTTEDTPIVIDVLANDTGIEPPTDTTPGTALAIELPPAHGEVTIGADRKVTYAPAPDWFGTDTFTYRVTDIRANGQAGETDSAVVTVTVTPVDDGPPVIVDDAWTVTENTSSAIDVLANDTVIDGVRSLTILGAPSHGTATVNPDHTVTYTPAPGYVGPDTFTYQVTDTDWQTGDGTVSVTVVPLDSGFPVAVADAFTTPEDTPYTVAVLTNDTVNDLPAVVTLATEPTHGTAVVNADGTITYTPALNYFGADCFTYQVADREGQPATATVSVTVTPVDDGEPVAVADAAATPEDAPVAVPVLANDTVTDGVQAVTILTPPAHGTAVVNPDRTVTYTPAAGFNGADAFAYQVTDLDGQAASAPVNITVSPVDSGAPIAVDDAFTTLEDTPYTVAVLTNDTVLDLPAVVTLVAAPAHGTAAVNADGTVSYTPAANWFGADAFTYRVTDLDGQSATATVSITVTPVNDAPPVAAPDAATTAEDVPVAVAVLANDTVIDGVAGVRILAPPVHGTAVVNPDRTITYTPAASWFGVDVFTYTVTDTDGQTASAPVNLTVTPVDDGAPLARADAFTTVEDTPLPSLAVLANDVVLDGPAVVTLAAPPSHGTASVNADGTIAYAPAPDFAGADAFTYRVADRDGQSATATVSITVTAVNDGPVAVPDSATASAGWPTVIPVLANDTDPDGDTLSLVSAAQGAHGAVTLLADGTVRYEAAPSFTGTDTFTYVVTDGKASATGTVTVTVGPPRDTDGDGVPDHVEDPNHDGTVDPGETDPRNPDTDGDGLPDGVEDPNHDGHVDSGETDPRNPDTNGDGILDGIGVRGGGCASGPGGAASLLLVGMAAVLRRRAARPTRR